VTRKEKEMIKKKDVKSHASERRLEINRHMAGFEQRETEECRQGGVGKRREKYWIKKTQR
jgi:hypothetical protein